MDNNINNNIKQKIDNNIGYLIICIVILIISIILGYYLNSIGDTKSDLCSSTCFVDIIFLIIIVALYARHKSLIGKQIINNNVQDFLNTVICPYCKQRISIDAVNKMQIPFTLQCPYCHYPLLVRWGTSTITVPNPASVGNILMNSNNQIPKYISANSPALIGEIIPVEKIEQNYGNNIDIRDSIINRSNIGGGSGSINNDITKLEYCPKCGERFGATKPAKYCPVCGEIL